MQKSNKNALLTSRNNQKNVSELECADGSSTDLLVLKGDPSKRSIGLLVLSIVNKVANEIDLTEDQCILTRSLLWPIVARCSKKKTFITTKNMKKLYDSLKITASRIKKHTTSDNREQVFIKYWLDYYMCKVFKDDQRPQREEWIKENLFSGWIRRFVSRMIAREDLAFIYSLNKGSKRVWPELGEERKRAAFEKHRTRLTTPHGEVSPSLRSIITVTSLSVFSTINTDPTLQKTTFPTKQVPSVAACIQALRENGGTKSLFPAFEMRKVLDGEDSRKIGVLRSLHQHYSSWTVNTYKYAHDRALSSFKGKGPFDLKAVAIPEPSKFRMITKGNGYLYTALQGLQGQMIDSWKNTRFSTMRDEDLTDRINIIQKNCSDLQYFCSVDYEAATDLIKKDATIAAFRPLRFVADYDLALLALTSNGKIRYPVDSLVEPGIVVDGQLMGHPLSFPLLCVINLSVLRHAVVQYISSSDSILQKYERERIGRLILDNVIVNGDDMLFKCPKDFYEFFKASAADAGFKLSVGKNYLSEKMCMINSQVFKKDHTGRMIRCGYLNQKFLVDDDSVLSNPTQVSKDLNKMVHLCPWTECIIPSVFLGKWKDYTIRDRGYKFQPNWYLPLHLGGYGVDPKFAPSNNKITVTQRKLARVFMKDVGTQLFLRDPELNINMVRTINKLVMDGLLSYKFVDPFRPLNIFETDESDPWLGRISLMTDMANTQEVSKGRHFSMTSFVNLRKIRPFTLEKIERLQQIKVIAHCRTSPPPLYPIRPLTPSNLFKELPFHQFPGMKFRGFGFV